MPYFNHRLHQTSSRWDLRAFARAWWRLARQDPRWTPPHNGRWRRALAPGGNAHLARMDPLFFYMEAIYRSGSRSSFTVQQRLPNAAMLERNVGTMQLARDPRRQDNSAYFGLLQSINNEDCLAQLLQRTGEKALDAGIFRLVGPVTFSPYLGSGVLQNYWDRFPPADTPSNPPYLPELVARHLRPLAQFRLLSLPVPDEDPTIAVTAVDFLPLDPARLAQDLLPLWQTAVSHPLFPPPDAVEAAFLLDYLGRETMQGWLARVDGAPAGFVLLQPDHGARRRRAGGGRSWIWRGWLKAMRALPVDRGLLRFGGVLPRWRGRGIGTGLLRMALRTARQRGWRQLQVGPVAEEETAVSWLQKRQGKLEQLYQLYEWMP